MSDNREAPAGTLETSDLLHGAGAIATFLNMTAAQVYHLHASAKLPTFKLPGGTTICARRSTLTQWLADCEAKARKAAEG